MLPQSQHHPVAILLISSCQISPCSGHLFILPCSGNIPEAFPCVPSYFSLHWIQLPELQFPLDPAKIPFTKPQCLLPSAAEPNTNVNTLFLNPKCSSSVSLSSPFLDRPPNIPPPPAIKQATICSPKARGPHAHVSPKPYL